MSRIHRYNFFLCVDIIGFPPNSQSIRINSIKESIHFSSFFSSLESKRAHTHNHICSKIKPQTGAFVVMQY